MDQLTNISRNYGTNVGSLLLVRLIPARHVINVPDAIASLIDSEVEIAEFEEWLEIIFERAGFDEPDTDTDHGVVYKQTLTVELGKDNQILTNFRKLANKYRYFIADITDGNGLRKLIGTLDCPLAYGSGLKTGDSPNAGNFSEFKFTATSTEPAPLYYP